MATEAELMSRMFDNTDAIIYLKDEEGRFLMVNKRAAEALNSTKEDVVGKKDTDFLPKEEVDIIRKMDEEVAATGKPLSRELTTSLPRGRVRILDHKFPISVEGHEHAVGGIAIEVKPS